MNIKKEVSVSKVAEIVIRELNLINIDVVEQKNTNSSSRSYAWICYFR